MKWICGILPLIVLGITSTARCQINIGPQVTCLSVLTDSCQALSEAPALAGLYVQGTGFGPQNGSSSVTINNVAATIIDWNNTNGWIQIQIAAATTSGNLVVHTSTGSSTGIPFMILTYACVPCTDLVPGMLAFMSPEGEGHVCPSSSRTWPFVRHELTDLVGVE